MRFWLRSNVMLHHIQPHPWLIMAGICCLTSCQPSPPPSNSYPTIDIIRVVSGQSIEWIDKSQQPPVIEQGKLAGIDAPDLGQDPWGEQAKQKLTESIGKSGKGTVNVEFDGTQADKFGRKFVYLWKDGRLLNEQLVREGAVLASMRNSTSGATTPDGSKYRERFIRASQYARLTGQGIWNTDLPLRMSPSEFRKEEK